MRHTWCAPRHVCGQDHGGLLHVLCTRLCMLQMQVDSSKELPHVQLAAVHARLNTLQKGHMLPQTYPRLGPFCPVCGIRSSSTPCCFSRVRVLRNSERSAPKYVQEQLFIQAYMLSHTSAQQSTPTNLRGCHGSDAFQLVLFLEFLEPLRDPLHRKRSGHLTIADVQPTISLLNSSSCPTRQAAEHVRLFDGRMPLFC